MHVVLGLGVGHAAVLAGAVDQGFDHGLPAFDVFLAFVPLVGEGDPGVLLGWGVALVSAGGRRHGRRNLVCCRHAEEEDGDCV